MDTRVHPRTIGEKPPDRKRASAAVHTFLASSPEVSRASLTSRGELLRLVASDAMRAAVVRHCGVRVAFQNCHRLALSDPNATDLYEHFITPRAQLLNQRPEFINC